MVSPLFLSKLKLLSFSALAATSLLLTASQPNEAARLEFTRALAASTTQMDDHNDSALLRSYVLYSYLQAARFQARLQAGTSDATMLVLDQEIAAFLTQQGMAPVTRELRRLWLSSLAARNEWRQFLQFYAVDAADTDLKCHALSAQLAIQNTLDTAALRALWLSAVRLPATCNPPFDWAKQQQIINSEWLDARARVALKAGNVELARELIAALPPAQAEPLTQWVLLIDKPQTALDALLSHPEKAAEEVALQDGWQRLARKDADAAIARLPRLIASRKMNEVTASRYVLDLALALSWSRRPEALRYFARVLPADMTEQAYEWQARAALWGADWSRVKRSIDAMPASLKAQPRWRYWLARAQEQSGEKQAAKTGYTALMDKEDNYYAAMAAARLSAAYAPHPQPLPLDEVEAERVAQLPALQRAGELVAVGLRDAADVEWQSVFNSLTNAEKEAAAQWAHQIGWHDQSIASLAKVNRYDDYELLYPRPYDVEVNEAAQRSHLAPELIYAVMRQETLFRPDAKSPANARGLLQLLPETARQVARRENLAAPTAEELYQPQVNVPLGAAYLRSLIDRFKGQTVLGLAAYNAGPIAAQRWLPTAPMQADIWIENIPYNETRAYVQRILWHGLIFSWLESHRAVDVKAWLMQVRPQ